MSLIVVSLYVKINSQKYKNSRPKLVKRHLCNTENPTEHSIKELYQSEWPNIFKCQFVEIIVENQLTVIVKI